METLALSMIPYFNLYQSVLKLYSSILIKDLSMKIFSASFFFAELKATKKYGGVISRS